MGSEINAINSNKKPITPIQLNENKTSEELNEIKAKKGETQVNYQQQVLAKTPVFENKTNPISKSATDISGALAGTITIKTTEVKQGDKNNATNVISGNYNNGKQVLASGLSETSKDDGMNKNKKEQENTYCIAHKTQRELFAERIGTNKESIFV